NAEDGDYGRYPATRGLSEGGGHALKRSGADLPAPGRGGRRGGGGCRHAVDESAARAARSILSWRRAQNAGSRWLALSAAMPTEPSSCSRRMSACPACRLVSVSMWTRMLNSVTLGRGHQGTWPGESTASAVMVASECIHTRR